MKPVFLPIITAVISGFAGPILAIFPMSIIPPIAIAAILIGGITAFEGGLVLGIIFLLIPQGKFLALLTMQRWKRILLIALIGGFCAAVQEIPDTRLFDSKLSWKSSYGMPTQALLQLWFYGLSLNMS
jgi:hypothetical protein